MCTSDIGEVSVLRAVVSATLLAMRLFVFPLLADRPAYDRSHEVTLEGSVLHVGEGSLGVYVFMRERAEPDARATVMVQLAPGSVLDREGIRLSRGDTIRIVGSRVMWNGAEMI